MNMVYRFAAAVALAIELLHAGHLITAPALLNTPPLTVTAVAFIVAFVVSELMDAIVHVITWWRGRRRPKNSRRL